MRMEYQFYKNVCESLKRNGFYPNRILDIGANIGDTADIMRDVWNKAYILLIEGNGECEQILKHKHHNYEIKILGKDNIPVIFYKTKWSPICTGNSIYRENTSTYNNDNVIYENREMYRLDDCNFGKFDLIKIDTQGSELDIICGGKNTFKNARVIIIEVRLVNYNEGGCSKEDVIDILSNMEFDLITNIENIYDNNGNIIFENLLFIKRPTKIPTSI